MSLPKGFKNAAGQYTDYKYRVMETNVGDTAVIFDKANGTEYADDQGNLPFKITSENNDDGTETTITNELLPTIKTSLTVTKKWSDYDNLYLTRPLNQDKWEAKFHVYRTYTKDGQENSERVLDTKGNPVVLTVTGADKTGNEESVILEDLPAKDLSGTLYEYSAVELNTNKEQTEVSGDKRFHGTYNVEYAQTKEKKPVSGTDLTVTHYTTTVTNTMKETALQVTKQWAGDDKGFRPKELNLTLYRKAAEGLWEAVTDSTGKNPATPKWTKMQTIHGQQHMNIYQCMLQLVSRICTLIR